VDTKAPRKTSGTFSAGDVVRNPDLVGTSLRGESSGDPAEDLESLKQGESFQTSTYRKAGWRWRSGRLLFEPGDGGLSIGWQSGMYYSAKRAAEPLTGPVVVEAVEPITGAVDRFWVKGHVFRRIRLTAAGQRWVIAVPTHDVPFVLAAFEIHG
jgi:hypothetical protein